MFGVLCFPKKQQQTPNAVIGVAPRIVCVVFIVRAEHPARVNSSARRFSITNYYAFFFSSLEQTARRAPSGGQRVCA